MAVIVKMPAAATIEVAGQSGFDFALIDTEHGPGDMAELEHHIRAADSVGIRVLVRVPGPDGPDILRALDAGASGIVVPHVNDPDVVSRAVAAAHYPPRGRRSLALSTRAASFGRRTAIEHLAIADQETILIGQLEDAESLGWIPEILASDGLTGIFIGPTDLSASLGWPGQADHPEVSEAIGGIVEAIRDVPSLCLGVLANNEAEVRDWAARGVGLIFVNATALLASQMATIIDTARHAGKETSGT